jgi:Golgi nucleoside diphosphatase
LSGEEEGYSSWITANYLNGLIKTATTNGVIELGGSSLQVAFSIDGEALHANANKYLVDIRVQNRNHKLYSHSFLCFGTTAIKHMYNAFIVRRENYARSMLAACYPENYDLELNREELIESPCVNGLMYNDQYEFVIDTLKITEVK